MVLYSPHLRHKDVRSHHVSLIFCAHSSCTCRTVFVGMLRRTVNPVMAGFTEQQAAVLMNNSLSVWKHYDREKSPRDQQHVANVSPGMFSRLADMHSGGKATAAAAAAAAATTAKEAAAAAPANTTAPRATGACCADYADMAEQ